MIVNQKTVSCIEKSQKKMIISQRTFFDQHQHALANFDVDLNHIKEKQSLFDLVLDRVKNKDIPSILQELCKIQGQFELAKKDTDNANNLQKENSSTIIGHADKLWHLQNTVSNQSTDVETLKIRMDNLENEVKKLYGLSNEYYTKLEQKIENNSKKTNQAINNLHSYCQSQISKLRAEVLDQKIDANSQKLNQKRFKTTAEEKVNQD